jgi:hypothetical protein
MDCYWVGRSGDRIPVAGEIRRSGPVLGRAQPRVEWLQDQFWEQRDVGVALTTHPHRAPKLQ